MTAIPLSPEQLNAEHAANAAIREAGPDTAYSPMGAMPPLLVCEGRHTIRAVVRDRHGGIHITACCLVLEARREWGYAHPDDLHVFRVPSDLEDVPLVPKDLDGPQEALLDAGELGGPAFALAFAAYLDAPHEPMVRAMRQYRVKCAGQHGTWSEHRGRAVCGDLLWSTVANGNLLAEAAEANGLTLERATALLYDALRLIWRWRAQTANGI